MEDTSWTLNIWTRTTWDTENEELKKRGVFRLHSAPRCVRFIAAVVVALTPDLTCEFLFGFYLLFYSLKNCSYRLIFANKVCHQHFEGVFNADIISLLALHIILLYPFYLGLCYPSWLLHLSFSQTICQYLLEPAPAEKKEIITFKKLS